MAELFKTNAIYDYNEWAGVETRHPLVGFIDFSTVKPLRHEGSITASMPYS